MKITPKQTLETIPQELDKTGWQLEFDATDIQVYSQYGVCNSDVIGFKTVTWLPVDAIIVFNFLKDVCGAMGKLNDMFVRGEQFRAWHDEVDKEGLLVRTSFKMPFPFANREFLHGLHSQQLDGNTYLVGYTPIDTEEIPIQNKYVRCNMYISGQRITALANGMTRVEHLMVYSLGGKVKKSIQDKWLKKFHIGAYIKEWRKLGRQLFPTKLESVDYAKLSALADYALKQSEHWHKVGRAKVGEVRVGRLPYCPRNIYRTNIEVKASLEKVVDVIADKSLEFLPQWNKEFMNGEVLEVLENTEAKTAWLIRVHYKTPAIIANREYIYYFSREWLNADEVLVFYQSVHHESPTPQGFIRALLYPTIHRLLRTKEGHTLIQHLLVTDLGGKLGKQQDKMLKGSLVQAHCRDMANQDKLLG